MVKTRKSSWQQAACHIIFISFFFSFVCIKSKGAQHISHAEWKSSLSPLSQCWKCTCLPVCISVWQKCRETSKGSRVVRVMWSRCLSDLLLCLSSSVFFCTRSSAVFFACVKENCICVTHEMATIYLFMHFKCVFSPPRVVSSLLASVLCVCVQPTTTVPAHMTLLSGVWKAPKLCSTLTHQVFFGLYSSSSSDPMQTWTHFHTCTLSHSPAKAIVLPRTIMSRFE